MGQEWLSQKAEELLRDRFTHTLAKARGHNNGSDIDEKSVQSVGSVTSVKSVKALNGPNRQNGLNGPNPINEVSLSRRDIPPCPNPPEAL